MPIIPDIPAPAQRITCTRCNTPKPATAYAATRSPFFANGRINICDDCVMTYLEAHNFEWDAIDKLCQWADIPFIVREWERAEGQWHTYAKLFAGRAYETLGWAHYYKQYKRLREAGLLVTELPLLDAEYYNSLREVWGLDYSDMDLEYLEDLYNGLTATQNVSSALQIDQARKLCKLSLLIDSYIRSGDKGVDKFLASYDKLVKIAEFTPRNTKNANDFDSFAEVAMWLEKRGYQARFYDNVTRDIVDETLKNLEAYNQRLYTNEAGIGNEITQRIEALRIVQQDDSLEALLTDKNSAGELEDYDAFGYAGEDDNSESDFEAFWETEGAALLGDPTGE